MTEKWTLYYVASGERFTENAWPTEDWAEYMARNHNEYVQYKTAHLVCTGRV